MSVENKEFYDQEMKWGGGGVVEQGVLVLKSGTLRLSYL